MTVSTAAMNMIWPISTPTLKNSRASGMAFCGKPISASAPANPRPCSRPKLKATTHGARDVSPQSPPPLQDLQSYEHDRKRDRRLDQGARDMDDAKGRQRQGDRVGHREGGDRLQQALEAAHEHDQRQHEQQMVEAGEDVLDSQQRIGPHHLQRARTGRHHKSWATSGMTRSSCTVPSLRATRTSTSMRVIERSEKAMVLPFNPPGEWMRQRCTAIPSA